MLLLIISNIKIKGGKTALCGFVGFANFKKDISDNPLIIKNMNKTLSKRGPDEEGYYIKEHIVLRA